MSALNKNIILLENMKHNTPMHSSLQIEQKFVVRLENINDTFTPFGKTLNGHANLSKTFRSTHQEEDYYDFKAPSNNYAKTAGESPLSQTLGIKGDSIKGDRYKRGQARLNQSIL